MLRVKLEQLLKEYEMAVAVIAIDDMEHDSMLRLKVKAVFLGLDEDGNAKFSSPSVELVVDPTWIQEAKAL